VGKDIIHIAIFDKGTSVPLITWFIVMVNQGLLIKI
jgi:hypothetical protein